MYWIISPKTLWGKCGEICVDMALKLFKTHWKKYGENDMTYVDYCLIVNLYGKPWKEKPITKFREQ